MLFNNENYSINYNLDDADIFNGTIYNWDNKKITLYRPDYKLMTLPDLAMCQSVHVFLKLMDKKFETEIANNCEYMSPKGFPFITVDDEYIYAGFENIVNYFEIEKTNKFIEIESIKTLLNYLYYLELALCWLDKDNFEITKKIFGIYPKPLNYILFYLKKLSVKNVLKQKFNSEFDILNSQTYFIIDELNKTLKAIDETVVVSDLFKDRVCLYAMIYGHIDAILNTKLKSLELKDIVKDCKNLIEIYDIIVKKIK